MAKQTIDLIAMLAEKTKGNLTSDEENLIRNFLYELRLMYVALTRAKDELTVHFPLRFHVHRFAQDDRHVLAQLSRFVEPVRDLFDEAGTAPPTDPGDGAGDGIIRVGVADEVDAQLASLWG